VNTEGAYSGLEQKFVQGVIESLTIWLIAYLHCLQINSIPPLMHSFSN
jgi:hypothetical protein